MPTSNFKLFDENKANMLSDTEYSSNAQRLNGVQSGIASSKLQNKFQYQASLIAYAIAQLMVQNGYDATDSTAVTTFVNNMSNTMLQKVVDKATDEQANVGIDTTKWMTPALVKSAITALAPMVSSILSNETKALYGLGPGAVPNDVLALLGKYKQHWWRRRVHTRTWEISLSSDGTNISISENETVQYSSTCHIDFYGKIFLDNPQTSVPVNYSNLDAINAAISSNYWSYGRWSDRSNFWYGGAPVGTYGGFTPGNTLRQVIANMTSENIGEWEFITSNNRNAYPDSGNKDGFDYQYIGVPLDNAVTAPNIETGSYVGTNTYGESNQNTLTFGFKPKIVIIVGHNFYISTAFIPFDGDTGFVHNATVSATWKLTRNGNTISWYANYAISSNGSSSSPSSANQLNDRDTTYYYIAIG